MAYVMLYGTGWTQRWEVAEDAIAVARAEIDRVGRNETSHLRVMDPSTGEPTHVVVAWQHVAAAAVVGARQNDAPQTSAGQYR
ncbi:hypothetical protein L2K70_17000 [Nocardioides KLBMP 9356]|uniref:Uncharacterized protein n=1 Tax=Nocardioides potassii TaxID=2911371 RepID=A0ABS9HDQ0_9ACTN|nr:hypothetical protein [Nocardioides potassii]MCF6379312.1 hypothetical protein [Nocardioides potassii]